MLGRGTAVVLVLALAARGVAWGQPAPGGGEPTGPGGAPATQPAVSTAAADAAATAGDEADHDGQGTRTDECHGEDEAPTIARWTECLAKAKASLEQATSSADASKAKAEEAEQQASEKLDVATKALEAAKANVDKLEADVAKAPAANKPAIEGHLATARTALSTAEAEHVAAREALEEATKAKLAVAHRVSDADLTVTALTEELAELEKVTSEEVQFGENDCSNTEVICVDHHGLPFFTEEVPSEAQPGLPLTVKVFMTTAQLVDETVAVAFAQRKSLDVPIEPTKKEVEVSTGDGTFDATRSPDAFHVQPFRSNTIDGDSDELVISFANTKKDGSKVERRYTLRIPHGYSYYSVALLIASVYQGDRTIRRDLTAFEDTAVEGAFALNVFPFGRRRGVVGLWRTCPWSLWQTLDCVGRTVGLTLGTDIDLTKPFDHLYGGIVIEPVAGLAFSAGVSLRQVEFVPPGPEVPGLSDGMVPVPVERGRVLRPYIGVTLTLDLLQTLADFKSAAAGITF